MSLPNVFLGERRSDSRRRRGRDRPDRRPVRGRHSRQPAQQQEIVTIGRQRLVYAAAHRATARLRAVPSATMTLLMPFGKYRNAMRVGPRRCRRAQTPASSRPATAGRSPSHPRKTSARERRFSQSDSWLSPSPPSHLERRALDDSSTKDRELVVIRWPPAGDLFHRRAGRRLQGRGPARTSAASHVTLRVKAPTATSASSFSPSRPRKICHPAASRVRSSTSPS